MQINILFTESSDEEDDYSYNYYSIHDSKYPRRQHTNNNQPCKVCLLLRIDKGKLTSTLDSKVCTILYQCWVGNLIEFICPCDGLHTFCNQIWKIKRNKLWMTSRFMDIQFKHCYIYLVEGKDVNDAYITLFNK